MLVLAYNYFTNGHVGSIQVAGLCGIKFQVMLQGLRTCFPLMTEYNVMKSWRREMIDVHLTAIYLFKSMLQSQISSKSFKLQFSFFPLLYSD